MRKIHKNQKVIPLKDVREKKYREWDDEFVYILRIDLDLAYAQKAYKIVAHPESGQKKVDFKRCLQTATD